MGRKKLPNNPQRKKQVKTFLERYGRQGYAIAGSAGGKNSPTRFTSETASAAAKKSWETRRAKAAEKENGKNVSNQQNQPGPI